MDESKKISESHEDNYSLARMNRIPPNLFTGKLSSYRVNIPRSIISLKVPLYHEMMLIHTEI